MLKIVLRGAAAALICGVAFAAMAQDFGGATQRFHNGARLTMDPSVRIQDEDSRWTLTANQLGKLAVLQGAAVSNDFWIVATITLTNSGGTTNGQTITVNGDTRTWTDATTASTIASNSTFYGAATNLFNALTTNGFSGLALALSSTNGITLTSGTNGVLAASCSTGWAAVSLATNSSKTVTAVFSPAFSAAPVVSIVGGTNDLAHVLSVSTTNATFGSAVTNGYFRWLAFGSP
jgi:hypothetical protein